MEDSTRSGVARFGGVSAHDGLKEFKSGTPKGAAALRNELSNLKSDLDSLVERSASLTDEELTQAHARLLTQFSSVRYAARGIATQASRQINRGLETTTGYMKEKPVQSVAVAIGTGLLLGMLFRRR